MLVRSAGLSLVAIIALAGAAACSAASSQAGIPQVASLIPSSAAASPTAAPKPERPRVRLDNTEADYQVLLKPYVSCMKAHGRSNEKENSGWAAGAGGRAEGVPEFLVVAALGAGSGEPGGQRLRPARGEMPERQGH